MKTLTLSLPKQNLIDTMASLLYALGQIPDSQNIKNIKFGDLNASEVKLEVTVDEVKEVLHINHNAD